MKKFLFSLVAAVLFACAAYAAPEPAPDDSDTQILVVGHGHDFTAIEFAAIDDFADFILVAKGGSEIRSVNAECLIKSLETFSIEDPGSKVRCESLEAIYYDFDFMPAKYLPVWKIGKPIPPTINYRGFRQIKI